MKKHPYPRPPPPVVIGTIVVATRTRRQMRDNATIENHHRNNCFGFNRSALRNINTYVIECGSHEGLTCFKTDE